MGTVVPAPWSSSQKEQGLAEHPAHPHLSHPGEVGDGWRPAGQSLYQKLPNIPLYYKSKLFFYFLSLQKELNTGQGTRGSLFWGEWLSQRCHLCAQPRLLSVGHGVTGVIQPSWDARGLSPRQGGDWGWPLPSASPPCLGWHHGDSPTAPAPISSPCQLSPDPVGLLGCPLWGPGPRGPLTGMMGRREVVPFATGTC